MPNSGDYVLDSNVFIEAHRRYYGFDLCPGFWQCLLHHGDAGRVVSIDRVKEELKAGDALGEWAKGEGRRLFVSSAAPAVVEWYREMIRWVRGQSQYRAAALNEFADVADGWLVAYAKSEGLTVVTHESEASFSRKSVHIPNVC